MYQGCTKDFDPVQTDIQGGAPGVTCPPVCLLMPVLERKTLNFPGSDTVRTGKRSQCHHPPCCPPLGCACLLIGGENNSRTSLPTLSYNCQNPMMRDIKAGHAGRSSGKRGRPLTWQKGRERSGMVLAHGWGLGETGLSSVRAVWGPPNVKFCYISYVCIP